MIQTTAAGNRKCELHKSTGPPSRNPKQGSLFEPWPVQQARQWFRADRTYDGLQAGASGEYPLTLRIDKCGIALPLGPQSFKACGSARLRGNVITRIVAAQVQVILCEAGLVHRHAGIARIPVPGMEPEPIVLALHRVSVVPPLCTAETEEVTEDPEIHHYFCRLVWDGQTLALLAPPYDLAVQIPCDSIRQPFEGVGVKVRTGVHAAT
mmetsp:Transcript_81059/g.224259  ORF Transcript_81059/g.224259 Transcript_81059/m.224259 type:complete len:209 (+) Transcript_81059:244-870(+)